MKEREKKKEKKKKRELEVHVSIIRRAHVLVLSGRKIKGVGIELRQQIRGLLHFDDVVLGVHKTICVVVMELAASNLVQMEATIHGGGGGDGGIGRVIIINEINHGLMKPNLGFQELYVMNGFIQH